LFGYVSDHGRIATKKAAVESKETFAGFIRRHVFS
jgi:hypothetical protein